MVKSEEFNDLNKGGCNRMWSNLKDEDKKTYRKLITNFASLSEAFSQKNESKEGGEDIVAPIVN